MKEQWQRLIATWPIETDRATSLFREFREVFAEVGDFRFRCGVDAILNARPYSSFPTKSEFLGYIPPSREPKQYCGHCDHGFVHVPDHEARQLYHDDSATMVRFCDCVGGRARAIRMKTHDD